MLLPYDMHVPDVGPHLHDDDSDDGAHHENDHTDVLQLRHVSASTVLAASTLLHIPPHLWVQMFRVWQRGGMPLPARWLCL